MTTYSKEFQEKMVAKLLLPGGPSILQLSQESSVSKSALYKWFNRYKQITNSSSTKDMAVSNGSSTEDSVPLNPNHKKLRPQNWSAEEKFKAIIETDSMSGEELGHYCREKGIYSHNLVNWQKSIIDGLKSSSNQEYRKKYQNLQKENKLLTKNLNRKDKALAETSALLVLKKKANLIWGDVEDDA